MKLIVPDYLVDSLGEPICRLAPDYELVPLTNEGKTVGDAGGAEVLFLRWGVPADVLHRLLRELEPDLRWLHTISAGIHYLGLSGLVGPDLTVTNSSGVFNTPIAETVLAYMLSVVKRLPEFFEQQRAHSWNTLHLRELCGLTVGIVGLGDIGTEVARLCQAFGMHVVGMVRKPRLSEYADEVLPPDQLSDLLSRSDFVVVSVPRTASTENLIGEQELEIIKPGAWLINIARGAIVDQEALVQALQEGRLSGACLDVFVDEPLPEDSPLWDMSNVMITPHNSWSSPQLRQRQADLFLDNLRRYIAGEPLRNVVDFEAGY